MVDRLIDCLSNHFSFDWLIDWLARWGSPIRLTRWSIDWLIDWVALNKLFPFFPQSCWHSGHLPSLPLPRALGRQRPVRGRTPAAHVPTVPHVRPLHPQRLHPRARLLRPPRRIPRALPPRRKRTRQRRGQPPLRQQRRPRPQRHGPRRPRPQRRQQGHVLCLSPGGPDRQHSNSHQNSPPPLTTHTDTIRTKKVPIPSSERKFLFCQKKNPQKLRKWHALSLPNILSLICIVAVLFFFHTHTPWWCVSWLPLQSFAELPLPATHTHTPHMSFSSSSIDQSINRSISRSVFFAVAVALQFFPHTYSSGWIFSSLLLSLEKRRSRGGWMEEGRKIFGTGFIASFIAALEERRPVLRSTVCLEKKRVALRISFLLIISSCLPRAPMRCVYITSLDSPPPPHMGIRIQSINQSINQSMQSSLFSQVYGLRNFSSSFLSADSPPPI